jgi:hypothetical protein
MAALLKLSAAIDRMTEFVGRSLYWLILVMVLVSTLNAISRKFLNVSSNGWLEMQWYMFAAVFMGCAGYALLRKEHIRIDIIASHLSDRANHRIALFGHIFFLVPLCLIMNGPDHVRVADRLPAARLPGRFRAGRQRHRLRLIGIELGLLTPNAVAGAAGARLRRHDNDTLLAIPFFTFMGLILERSGMAEDLLDTIGQLFGPMRGGLAYAVDLRRRAAGRHHRRRGGLGDLDGPDLAADHAALRLRPAARVRRHRRLGHAGADHSAVSSC